MGADERVTIDGTVWEVEPDMTAETVILLWGLFDEEIYVEFTGKTWGPYYPVSGPVPLHRYRTFRRGKAAERADCIHALARQLNIPISALSGSDLRVVSDIDIPVSNTVAILVCKCLQCIFLPAGHSAVKGIPAGSQIRMVSCTGPQHCAKAS